MRQTPPTLSRHCTNLKTQVTSTSSKCSAKCLQRARKSGQKVLCVISLEGSGSPQEALRPQTLSPLQIILPMPRCLPSSFPIDFVSCMLNTLRVLGVHARCTGAQASAGINLGSHDAPETCPLKTQMQRSRHHERATRKLSQAHCKCKCKYKWQVQVASASGKYKWQVASTTVTRNKQVQYKWQVQVPTKSKLFKSGKNSPA